MINLDYHEGLVVGKDASADEVKNALRCGLILTIRAIFDTFGAQHPVLAPASAGLFCKAHR